MAPRGGVWTVGMASSQDFGAIIELADTSTLGLLHISEIAHSRTANVTDELKMGQDLEVSRQCSSSQP
eukprot:8874277-Pyramimonas_sp.AAC.1